MKAAVLGAGAWGTALAKLLGEKGGAVSLWTRREAHADALAAARENARYLPGVRLPAGVSITADLGLALAQADTVMFALPSQSMREVARAAAPFIARADVPEPLVIGATKGIERGSLLFMDQVLSEELPEGVRGRLAVLSGPSFARELAAEVPTAVVLASRDAAVCEEAVRRLQTPYFRTYASRDVVGVECGGAMKNVIAIATGAVSGLGLGDNTRAAIVTRGLAEMARLAVARGGSALTLAGLAGVGDLLLTCTGELSRNRRVGIELARGKSLESVLADLGHVAEGVETARSAHALAARLGIDMPITAQVHAVLFEGKPVRRAAVDLMGRELGYEFDPRVTARFASGAG